MGQLYPIFSNITIQLIINLFIQDRDHSHLSNIANEMEVYSRNVKPGRIRLEELPDFVFKYGLTTKRFTEYVKLRCMNR